MEWEKSDIHLTKFCGFCLTSLSKHKQKWKKKQNQKTKQSTLNIYLNADKFLWQSSSFKARI